MVRQTNTQESLHLGPVNAPANERRSAQRTAAPRAVRCAARRVTCEARCVRARSCAQQQTQRACTPVA